MYNTTRSPLKKGRQVHRCERGVPEPLKPPGYALGRSNSRFVSTLLVALKNIFSLDVKIKSSVAIGVFKDSRNFFKLKFYTDERRSESKAPKS